MDLDLTEEQQMVIDMTRGMLAEHSTTAIVRDMEDDPKGYPDALWKQMSELGLNGLLIPEAYGGGGQTLLEGTFVYEEIGRAMAPTPHFVSCVMSAGVLLEAGSEEQKKAWLPRIANGDAILTPAWLEPQRGFGEAGIALKATADGDGFKLNGRKRLVAYASSAERLVVLARTSAGVDLFLVDPRAKGVQLKQLLSQGREAQYQVDFTDVKAAAADRIGAPGSGWKTWNTVMLQGIILLAASAVGGAARCLEETVVYANQRVQFDKPLGAFQAISHYLADGATSVDGGKTLVYEAAWARASGRSIAKLAPMAKLFACQTYRDLTATCQQVWGGVGFTLEYDIQLYFRRAKQLQITWWDTRYLEELVARAVLD
jgi:alkylation response protein AidB-like acyl-CoA dehydrogenase